MSHTHILVEQKSQHYAALYRASDGMRIAAWSRQTVLYGDDPNKGEARAFIDDEAARKYILTAVPQRDAEKHELKRYSVDIRDGEGQVILPSDSMRLPGPLSGTTVHKI